MSRRIRRLFAGRPAIVLATVALLAPASAAAGIRVGAVDTSGYPSLRVTLVAPEGAAQPRLWEDGRPVSGYSATNLGKAKSIVLAIDRSKSMAGAPLAAARAAAADFAAAAGGSDHVGVVEFGRTAFVLTRVSASPNEARSALADVAVDSKSGTALYDGIVAAARRLESEERPGRAVVVLTDGRDVSSAASLADAVAAAQHARAAVYTIGIAGPDFTADALRRIATQTGGSYHQAASSGDLSAVYASLQRELARTWQLEYVTAARPGDNLRLNATVPGAGRATSRVALPVLDGVSTVRGATKLIPSVGYSSFGTLLMGAAAGLLVLLACGFWFAARQGVWLKTRLEPHLGSVRKAAKERRAEGRKAARTRFVDTVENTFANVKQFRRLARMIERADLPLRAGELAVMSAAAAFVPGLVAAVAAAPAFLILLVMGCFGAVPILFVWFKANARLKKFENQLADLLITIAASLKAGHSFRQGIQSVVDEGAEPAAKEFKRVMTETQLGKPMDDALADMAERVGSKDFSFVITAVTIQRQIGGSLAGLFDMVADTVRQRQQFARKIKGLTAMGRMSAYVLIGLPFFLAGIVTVMNPTFIGPLYHTSAGQKMMVAALVMMALGSLMLKKIVSFRG